MRRFSELDPLFPYFFAVYAHFKRKQYTIKSGLKYGTDFGENIWDPIFGFVSNHFFGFSVLYEYGPSVSHSLYSVYVLVPGVRDSGLAAVDAMQRASNTVKKDLLLVRVSSPGLTLEDRMAPDCFTKMLLTVEFILRAVPVSGKNLFVFSQEIIVRRREKLTNLAV